LIAALARHLPELKVEGVAAGLHLVVRLPAGVDDSAIARDAKSAGIDVAALTAFRIKPASSGGLVIGYGRVQELAIEPAVRELAGVTRPFLRSRSSPSVPMLVPPLAAASMNYRA
jgi:GntR family transcriptional regulator/MocR family aminotransferase